jgi:hypothetical protein
MLTAKIIKKIKNYNFLEYTLFFQGDVFYRILRKNNNSLVGKNSFNKENIECFNIIEEKEEEIILEKTSFYINKDNYIILSFDNKEFSLHSFVLFVWPDKNGKLYQKGLEIDHINGDKFNNTINNLEVITKFQNLARAVCNNYKYSLKYLKKYLENFSENEIELLKKEIEDDKKYYIKKNLLKEFENFFIIMKKF